MAPTRWRGGDFALKLANAGELPDLQEVLATDDGPNIPRGRLLAEDLLSRAPGAPVFDDPEAPAMIVFTSGSTAEPKGVVHSQRTFECELRSLGTLYRNGWRGGFLNALPAGHVAGMLGALRGLYHGLDCVYTEAWNPEEARELLERFQLTWSMGAPFHLAGLIEASAGRGLSSLRAYLVGAAPVPEEMVARADKLGFAAFRSYGSSELPSLSCGAPWESLSERANSDGALMDGVEVRLVDDEGRAVAEGEPGEILARAPELFIGYTVPSLTAEAVTDDGFFRTGDVGVLRNGRLTIVDRKKDIIIRGGENIASREVEDILLTHPAVAEAAAIGRPDPTYGEKVAAFLKLRPGTDLDLEAVRAHFAAAGTARQKTPESIHIVDDLPRTPSGKVRKPELRARFTNPSV